MGAAGAGGLWAPLPAQPLLRTDLLQASAPARIVNVSSFRHSAGTADGCYLTGKERPGSYDAAYNSTKLMNILFTAELARRLQGTGGCWAELCRAVPCHTVHGCTMPYHATPCMLYHAIPCHTMPHGAVPHNAQLHPAEPCRAMQLLGRAAPWGHLPVLTPPTLLCGDMGALRWG